jgi:hypothetical protein
MSFIQSVTGPSFQTGFTFTTNNISVDDISCNTLEANTAVIQDLTTVNFQPIILNTSTLSASAAYIDDIFCQNISSTGIIDAFEINVCNIDIENVSVEKASMTEADVSLLVIKDQTNTKQSEIERDNDILTIAGGYVEGTNQYTGDIDLTPYHQGNSSIVSLKVRASDGGVIIPNLESTNITMTTLNSNVVNVSYLYIDEVTTYKNAGNAKATILTTSNSIQFSSGSSVAQIFTAGVDEYININPTTNKTTILNAYLDGNTIVDGNLDLVGDINVGDINVSNVNVSELNVSHIEGINISCDNLSVTNDISCDNIIRAYNLQSSGDVNVSNDVIIGNNLSVEYNANVSNISVRGYGYVRWDLNVSNSIYAEANLDAGNSIFANANITAGGTVTSTGYNFRRTPDDGGLTMATMFADANSLDMTLSYDWNVYKNSTSGTKIMNIDYGSSRVNISNLSVDNLSTNLLNNLSAGENISLTTDPTTQQIVITGQGGLNSSNLSLDNLSVTDSFTCNDAQIDDLFNCDMTNSLRGGTSGVDIPFDNISVEFSTGSLDTLVMLKPNIVLYNISLLPNIITLAPPTFEMTTGTAQITNANMSNLSVNNLSVITDITTPSATITDLTITGGGTFNHDLINSLAVGANMSIVSVNNKPRIGVKHNINLSNVSVEGAVHITERMAVGGVDFRHTGTNNLISYIDVNGPSMKWYLNKTMDFRKDDGNGIVFMKLNHAVGNVNISNLSIDNTSTNNISVLESITVGTGGIGGGVYAKNGTGVFSTGGFYLNNAIDGSGGNLNIFWTGGNISAYGIGTLDGHDVRLANGYNTGGLVVDGTLNNINMSNCSITNLSVNVVQSSLNNASVINTEFLNVSGSAPFFGDGLTVYGSTTTQNISTNHISSAGFITAAGDIRAGGGFRATGGSGIISTGPIHFNNANNGLGDSLEIYYTGTEFGMGTVSGKDFRINAGYNTGGLVVDGTINNINMSNCSITNLSLDTLTCDLTSNLTAGNNITITSVGGKPVIASSGGGSLPTNASFDNVSISNKLTVVDSIGCQTLGVDGNIQTSNSFTIRKDAFTALTQTINGNEFRISTTSSNQDIRVCNATGAGGLLFNAGINNISIDNLSAVNLSLTNLTTDLTSNLTAGTNITITSVGGKPVISASGGGGVTDPLNLSQLNVSNISVDVDVTIARDLNVQRYLDSGRPRFMMLARTNDLALSGAGERGATFNTNSTAQVAGEFGVANGGEIQVSTGGWYRLSWAIGFVLTNSGNRVSFRTYNMTRTNAGGWTYVQLKDRLGSVGYCRSSSLNQETVSNGSVLRYIPANGWVRVNIGAMIQGSTNFSSSFNNVNLRGSSNFMVEFISSASET